MYKRFLFEGDIHQSLDCVPLTVRRKLDLAGVKIALAGWQQLPREERLCLCHLPVQFPEELAIYREVMLAFCDRHTISWTVLHDPMVDARLWNAPAIPTALALRLAALGCHGLDDDAWVALDEESRYALVKLADPKRNPAKLPSALVELGFLPGPAPLASPVAAMCDATASAS